MIALDWSKSNGQILEGTYHHEEHKLWTRYHDFVNQELTLKKSSKGTLVFLSLIKLTGLLSPTTAAPSPLRRPSRTKRSMVCSLASASAAATWPECPAPAAHRQRHGSPSMVLTRPQRVGR